jgi:type IV pilus assembly protein PilO
MAPPPPAKAGPRLSSPVKLLIGFAGLGVVALVYYFFFYNDLSNAVNAAVDRHRQLQNEDNQAAAAYKAYVDDSTKLEEKKARARDLNKMLPETTEIASFLQAVNQQAEIAGLKVKNVTPMDEQNQPFYARVPVKLSVTGKFHQIAKFFAGISRLDRIINVENIDMGSPKIGDNDETTLSASCLTTTFRALAKPATPAPGAPGAPAGSAAPPAPGAPPK